MPEVVENGNEISARIVESQNDVRKSTNNRIICEQLSHSTLKPLSPVDQASTEFGILTREL